MIAIVLLWLTIGSSVIWAVEHWALRLLLLAVAAAVTLHLARLNSLTPAMLAEIAEREERDAALPADPAAE